MTTQMFKKTNRAVGEKSVLLLNKQKDCLTTSDDPNNRKQCSICKKCLQ